MTNNISSKNYIFKYIRYYFIDIVHIMQYITHKGAKRMISIRPLKIKLVDKNMNFSELSKETGISSETIYRMKNNMGVSMSTIDKLCAYFNCGISDIIEFVEGSSETEEDK